MSRIHLQSLLFSLCLAASLPVIAACGESPLGTGGTGASSSSASSSGSSSSGMGGSGGTGEPLPKADDIVAELRADTNAAVEKWGDKAGWPVAVEGGYLFVSLNTSLDKAAGDHDGWAGTPMTHEQGFAWVVIDVPMNDRYKFTDGTTYEPDPIARSFDYDNFGEISLVLPTGLHVDRHLAVKDAALGPRTVRVRVPTGTVSRVLYVHDGQNIFDPDAIWGGWKLYQNQPDDILIVGIDNTPARMDEYTHVTDVIQGQTLGGLGDAYADFLKGTVRPLVQKHYGEPPVVGVMGSSLGGLISFVVADRHPNDYAFAASLSGTMGWGSIGNGVHNQTIFQRMAAHGHQKPVLYLDSGGSGTTCADSDADGVDDDDQSAGDNYCENLQTYDVLLSAGYADGQDLHYVWEPDAQHNEAAWALRVNVPIQIFESL